MWRLMIGVHGVTQKDKTKAGEKWQMTNKKKDWKCILGKARDLRGK